ncbi:hypothetical protein [Bradyrhizobium sp. USDA 223]|uniref:hypothetical protein n=1 Tax=Bradyrhizobium sp. USDA 223 TaxID=3156306 RepID=UPI00384BE66C
MTTAYDAVTRASPTQRSTSFSSVIVSARSARSVHDTLPISMAMMNHHLEAASSTRPRALVVADILFLNFHLSLDETIRKAGGETRGRRQASGIMRALVIANPSDAASWCVWSLPQSAHVMGA